MGYYYDGKYTITYSEDILVSLALDADRFQNYLAELPWTSYGIDLYTSGNPIESLIQELGWETETQTQEPNGNSVLSGYVDSARYNNALDASIKWLATHGVGLDITLHGEDGESWTWQQNIGESGAQKEMLIPIRESQHTAIKRIQSYLDSISDCLSLLGEKELYEQVQDYKKSIKNI